MGSRAAAPPPTPDRRAKPAPHPAVQVALIVSAAVVILAILGALLFLVVTDRQAQMRAFLEAISGPSGLLAIIGIAVNTWQNWNLKRQGGRNEALAGRVLPEVIRERTEPLQQIAPALPPEPSAPPVPHGASPLDPDTLREELLRGPRPPEPSWHHITTGTPDYTRLPEDPAHPGA